MRKIYEVKKHKYRKYFHNHLQSRFLCPVCKHDVIKCKRNKKQNNKKHHFFHHSSLRTNRMPTSPFLNAAVVFLLGAFPNSEQTYDLRNKQTSLK